MEQDAPGGQPTEPETQSAPPEEPVSTSPGGPPADAAEEPAPAAGTPAADTPGEAAGEHAGGPVEMAKEKLEEVKDKIAPVLEEAKEKIAPKIEDAKEKIGPKIEVAKEKVGPALGEAGNKVKPALEKIKGMVQELLSKIRKKPAALAAGGGAGSSPLHPSAVPALNSFDAWPSERASFGSLLAPKSKKAITRMMSSSGAPRSTLATLPRQGGSKAPTGLKNPSGMRGVVHC